MGVVYPWQKKQWNNLVSQNKQGRLPHAFLLNGIEGLGKKAFALHFSQYLLCDSPNDQACGLCRSCQLFQANNHPDFLCIEPEEKSKSIKVDQMRNLISTFSQTAHRGFRQVAIIYPAELMNRSSANAVLKTLEEPQGDKVFLLLCHQMHTLPATLRSRCQKVYFSAADDEISLTWLQQQLAPNQNAKQLLKISGYAPLRALELSHNDYFARRDDLLEQLLIALKPTENPIQAVEQLVKQELSESLDIFMHIVLDILKLQLKVDPQLLYNQDCASQLNQLNQMIQLKSLLKFLDYLQEARQLQKGAFNANAQLLLEGLLIRWQTLGGKHVR